MNYSRMSLAHQLKSSDSAAIAIMSSHIESVHLRVTDLHVPRWLTEIERFFKPDVLMMSADKCMKIPIFNLVHFTLMNGDDDDEI